MLQKIYRQSNETFFFMLMILMFVFDKLDVAEFKDGNVMVCLRKVNVIRFWKTPELNVI